MSTDDALLALTLMATWAARTGRAVRAVPPTDLSAEELETFWCDDQLEAPYATPKRRLW